MNPYEILKNVRSTSHHTAMLYVEGIFDRFIELHGDRCGNDDPAIIGGIAWIEDMPVFLIIMEKGRNEREKVYRNFGSPRPGGYRKASRVMRLAQKLRVPVLCMVDTIGADCSVEAEHDGQAQAIAECLKTSVELTVPSISIIIGEAESGGAIALAASNEVWMMENAVFSVITPESCALILWGNTDYAKTAADFLRITAENAFEDKIIDRIIGEKGDLATVCKELRISIYGKIKELNELSEDEILEKRYEKFRRIY